MSEESIVEWIKTIILSADILAVFQINSVILEQMR